MILPTIETTGFGLERDLASIFRYLIPSVNIDFSVNISKFCFISDIQGSFRNLELKNNNWASRMLVVAFATALLATGAAKLLQFIGQYLVLGELFLEYGLLSFFFPGTIVMIVAGVLANVVMISRKAMSFDNILKTYAIIGITAAAILITHSVLTQAPMPRMIGDIFGRRDQSVLLSIFLLIPISAVPIVTYIFVTNWTGLWLSQVFGIQITRDTAKGRSSAT